MSALIHQFVVHRIVLTQEGKLELVPRQQCLAVTPEIESLAHQIHHTFNSKPGKGVGHFSQSEGEETSFVDDLATYLQAVKDKSADIAESFQSFSLAGAKRLLQALLDTGQVESGFLIFTHYETLATQYLMVTLLNTKEHVEVNQALELTSREHLDLAKMQLAVRLDLTEYTIQPEKQRYVSFIKGRMGRKVSDFFMQFVNCEELVDVKQQNKQLIQSVDTYLSSEQLDPQEKANQREEVKQYFKEKIDSGESIQLEELSEKISSSADATQTFAAFTENLEAPIEKEFQPDPAALRQLAKFSGQGGGISLSFERKLLGDRVSYDANTDTLVIKGIPPNLKDQLLRNQ